MFKITEIYEVSQLCLNLTLCRNLLMGSSGETCLLVPFSTAHSFYCINKDYFPTCGKQLFWNNWFLLTFPLSQPTFSIPIVGNRTSTDSYKMPRYVVIPQEPSLERTISNQEEEMQLPAINVIPNRRGIFLAVAFQTFCFKVITQMAMPKNHHVFPAALGLFPLSSN